MPSARGGSSSDPKKNSRQSPWVSWFCLQSWTAHGVEACFLASHWESQGILSRSYFRMGNVVNSLHAQSTDSLSRP